MMLAGMIPTLDPVTYMLLVGGIMGFLKVFITPIKVWVEKKWYNGVEQKQFEMGLAAIVTVAVHFLLQLLLMAVSDTVALTAGEFIGMLGLGVATPVAVRHVQENNKQRKETNAMNETKTGE